MLRLGKPLIVVPNSSLLDNHQQDLATELEKLGYLKATTPRCVKEVVKYVHSEVKFRLRSLHECVSTFDIKELVPFPQKDKGKFQALLDEMMGFD